jgi:hypothetical protein
LWAACPQFETTHIIDIMRLDPEQSSKNRQCCSGKEEDKQNCTGIYSVGIYLLSVNTFLVIYEVCPDSTAELQLKVGAP